VQHDDQAAAELLVDAIHALLLCDVALALRWFGMAQDQLPCQAYRGEEQDAAKCSHPGFSAEGNGPVHPKWSQG